MQQIQRGTAVRGYDTLTGRQKHQRVAQAQRKFVAGNADEADRAILHAHATRVAGNQKRVAATRAFNAITGTTALDVANAGGAADRAARAVKKSGSVSTSGIGGAVAKAALHTAESIAPGATAALKAFHLAGGKDKQLAAPALAALDQTTRAGNAVRAGIKHDIQRGGIAEPFIGVHAPRSKAAKERRQETSRGFALKERTSGADVLKAAGVKNKTARAIGGLGVDIVTDSATTPTFGVGGAAAREGEKVAARVIGKSGAAARKAEKEAARQAAARGANRAGRKQAARVAGNAVRTQARARARKEARDVGDVGLAVRRSETAHAQLTNATTSGASAKRIRDLKKTAQRAEKRVKRARKNAPRTNRGITVRALGREVPGVRVATAAAARGGRKVLRRAPAKTEAARRTDREFLQSERTARATRNEGQARAVRVATQARHGFNDHEFEKVALALDRGDLGSLTPSWRKALKEAKGDRKAAREVMKRDHEDELRMVNAAHDVRSALAHGYRQARRAGTTSSKRAEDFLTASDLGKLKKTVKSQKAEAKEAVRRSERHEGAAGSAAQLRQTEAELRAQGATRTAQARATGQARTQQAQQAGRARVATEKVRGKEARRVAVEREQGTRRAQVTTERVRGREALNVAVGRQQDIARTRAAVVEARRRLKAELAKPVTRRKGVATLEAKVRRREQEWRDARGARPSARMSAVRPQVEPPVGVSAVRPQVAAPVVETVAPKTARAGAAALRYERHAGQTAYHQQRRAAAERIPVRGRGAGVPLDETHVAWLKRVRRHAQRNDLALLKKRVDKLLAKAPKDVAGGYFPREYEERALKTLGLAERKDFEGTKAVRGGQRRTVKTPTAGFARTDVRPLDVVQRDLRDAGKPEFTTNVPLAAATHTREMARAASEAGFARDLAHRFGRKVTDPSQLQEGESLYKLGTTGGKGYGLHPARSIPKTGKAGGQYVALKDDVVNRMQQEIQAVPRVDSKALRVWDKLTGGFKTLAISNPAFYIRNAIGDVTRLMEMPGNPLRNVANLRQGVQGVRAVRQAERFHQAPGKVLKTVPLGNKIRVGGEQVEARDFVNRARSHGLIDAGFHGREQAELFHPERAFGDVRGGSRKSQFIRQLHKPLTIDRENATRLAAFKAGLDMGLSDHEAADLAHRFFVDYGRLSPAERIYARRAFPFYTWTARSAPVTIKNWVKNPARYANLEMAREEWNQAVTGLSEDEIRAQMAPGTQRQIPFVIPLGHGRFAAVSASFPANLLNLVPTGLGPKAAQGYGKELLQQGSQLIHPGLRDLIELKTGTSLATKQDIEGARHPLASAPDWVKYLPQSSKRYLEVTDQYVDKRTGKKGLAWRGWADWTWRQVPGGPQQIAGLTSGERPGQTSGGAAAVARLLGARVDDMSPEIAKRTAEIKDFKRQADVNKKLGFLKGQGIDKDHPNAEYLKLRAEANALNKKLYPRTKKGAGKLDIGLGGTGGPKVDIGLGNSVGPKVDIGLGG